LFFDCHVVKSSQLTLADNSFVSAKPSKIKKNLQLRAHVTFQIYPAMRKLSEEITPPRPPPPAMPVQTAPPPRPPLPTLEENPGEDIFRKPSKGLIMVGIILDHKYVTLYMYCSGRKIRDVLVQKSSTCTDVKGSN
jgi:hypothetical protein